MNRRNRTTFGIMLAAGLLAGAALRAQTVPRHLPAEVLPPGARPWLQVEDPATGAEWLLVRDPAHPGGPGRWLGLGADPERAHRASRPAEAQTLPAIRAGDRLRVERHTAVVDETLEAVAVSSAIAGGRLTVRLVLGGRLLPARALSPGRAELDPPGEGTMAAPPASGAGL